MEKTTVYLPELLFGTSDKKGALALSGLLKKGLIKKIAPRIYTSNLSANPETLISRNILGILGHLYPGSLLSHRSAIEYAPTSSGHIFVTHSYTKKITLPGIVICFIEGHGPIPADTLLNGLYVSSLERALLENMQQSRKEGGESKTLSKKEITGILENIGLTNGDEQLNILLFKASAAADALGMRWEYNRLNKIITRLLEKKPARARKSPLAAAKIFGEPHDNAIILQLETLYKDLSLVLLPELPEKNLSLQAFRNFAFFESYFSANIENEWLHLASAKDIINSHLTEIDPDYVGFKGLYNVASDWKELKQAPGSEDEFIESLRYRHSLIYRGAENKKPGLFRDTTPVGWPDYKKVTGTLKKAFPYYKGLKSAFARAICLHFIINEIKPFHYGNGIMARLMMNAEMVAANQSKILVSPQNIHLIQNTATSLARQEYIIALRKAWQFSAAIFGNDFDKMGEGIENLLG